MRPNGDVEAAKGRVPLLLLVELLDMRGSGSGVDCCCLSSRGDDAERAQPEGSGVAEEEAALAKTETAPPPPLAAESRLPDEAAACLSRA